MPTDNSDSKSMEAALRSIYPSDGEFCRDCLLNRSAIAFPAAPHGKLDGTPADILLVGWNPEIRGYPKNDDGSYRIPSTYEAWIEDARNGLKSPRSSFQALVGSLLPPTHSLTSGRVVNTRMWRWPSASKPGTEKNGQVCSKKHLWAEIRAFRSKVVLTYDRDAANELASLLVGAGIKLHVQPFVTKRHHHVRWCEPVEYQGARSAFVLATGHRDKGAASNPNSERAWIAGKIAELLTRAD